MLISLCSLQRIRVGHQSVLYFHRVTDTHGPHPIARTFPANGSFTPEQATLYNALLTVQKHLITLCTEAAGMSILQIHRESCTLLRKELERIGFSFPLGAGTLDTLYPHLIGHPVGIDLHESSHMERDAPYVR